VDYAHIPEKYIKSTIVKDGFQICTYQAQLLHEDFPVLLNVVILVKTNLATQAWGHVILFSSDLELSCENLVNYYSLRFQIEFNFRDAKQFWGLEDFMNVNPTSVTNAANLSLFMVNLSQLLMCDFRQTDPDFGVLDLKSYYLRNPVKSHTLTGVCRTAGREKTLVKNIVHQVCGMVRFPRNFL